MDLATGRTLARAALRSTEFLAADRIEYPDDRVGAVLETPDGESFTVYRETALTARPAETTDGVVLIFGMTVNDRTLAGLTRFALYHRLANVATPFFVGMPGFRRKLWLAGEAPGTFLELYEWSSAADAERFVDVLQSLLGPFDATGAASYEIVSAKSTTAFLEATDYGWRSDEPTARSRRLGRVVPVILAAVIGYVLWRYAANRGG